MRQNEDDRGAVKWTYNLEFIGYGTDRFVYEHSKMTVVKQKLTNSDKMNGNTAFLPYALLTG
jgi:hypothetical protein